MGHRSSVNIAEVFTARGAMHYIEIACRLSVHPSVRLSATLVDQDHISWKSWKLIARQLAQHLRSS